VLFGYSEDLGLVLTVSREQRLCQETCPMVHSHLLGPKDRKLVAPSVRAGLDAVNCLSARGAPRFVPARRASDCLKEDFPALTDGATNFRSFGPKAGVIEPDRHQF
jgi:hypothetical protein